jgi:hypothetical protein
MLIFFAGTGSNNKPHHDLQPGQATMIYKAVETSKSSSSTAYPENIVLEDENIQIVLEEATEQIQDAENAQLAVESKEIDSTTTKITNNLRIGIGKLFGSALSNDEMEEVATQVQVQLKDEAQIKLRGRADSITKIAIAAIEKTVSDEEDSEMDESTIEENVLKHQKKALREVKDKIDAELSVVQEQLPTRAIEIEKAILEERLSTKLGKRVKLVIDEDNEISNTSNDDALFSGLSSFSDLKEKTTSSSDSGNAFEYTSATSSSSLNTSTNKYEPSMVPPSYATSETSNFLSSNTDGSAKPKQTEVSLPKSKSFVTYSSAETLGADATKIDTNGTNSTFENKSTNDIASAPTTNSILYNKKKKKSMTSGGRN